jgi:pimeloyl-ACP methyl ester carboxylesterase
MRAVILLGSAKAFLVNKCDRPQPPGSKWVNVSLNDGPRRVDYELKKYVLKDHQTTDGIVIFSHGFTGCYSNFVPLVNFLDDKGLTVYAPNFNGDPSSLTVGTITAQSEFLRRVINQLCAYTACHLIGYSMGGLASVLAVRHATCKNVKTVQTYNSPIYFHPTPFEPSWGVEYFLLHQVTKAISIPLWSWSTGLEDTVILTELTRHIGTRTFHQMETSATPGIYDIGNHRAFLQDVGHPLHGKFYEIIRHGFLPLSEAEGRNTFEVRSHFSPVPGSQPSETVSGCKATGPAKLTVSADCPAEYLEMFGDSGKVDATVFFEKVDGAWEQTLLNRFDIPGSGFSVGLLPLLGQVRTVVIPEGVHVALKSAQQVIIKKQELPTGHIFPVLLVHAGRGIVGADGSAGRNSEVNMLASVKHIWTIGDAKVEWDYWSSINYVQARHTTSTLIGYIISTSIGNHVINMGYQLLIIILLSHSPVHVFVFLFAVMVTYMFKLILLKIPAVPKWYWWVNILLCLAYAQVGLHFIAWQVEDRRERQLGIVLAMMKSPTLLALISVTWECLFRINTPGVISAVLPGPTWDTLLMMTIPLINLHAGDHIEMTPSFMDRRELILGLISAGLIAYGTEEYWQTILLLAVIIPINVYKRTTESVNPILQSKSE